MSLFKTKWLKLVATTMLFGLVATPAFAATEVSKLTSNTNFSQVNQGIRFKGSMTPYRAQTGETLEVTFVINRKYKDATSYNTDKVWKINSDTNPWVELVAGKPSVTGAGFYNLSGDYDRTYFRANWVPRETGTYRIRAHVDWIDENNEEHRVSTAWKVFTITSDAASKNVYVSRPVCDATYETSDTVKFTNYVKPRVTKTSGSWMLYYIDKRNSDNIYKLSRVEDAKFDYTRSDYKYSTPAKGYFRNVPSGHYRVVAKLFWVKQDGSIKTYKSSYRYFTVVK